MRDLRVLARYLAPCRRDFAAAVALLLAECCLEMAIPLLMSRAIDGGVAAGDAAFLCRQGVLGKGVQLRLFDPTNITPPALAQLALRVAEEQHIPCQPSVRRTGGTDAAASYPNWQGAPAIVLGVPTRYIHSHNGILDERDLAACVDLTCALVRAIAARGLAELIED